MEGSKEKGISGGRIQNRLVMRKPQKPKTTRPLTRPRGPLSYVFSEVSGLTSVMTTHSPKTDPPIAARPPILTPASKPTGPPKHVPSRAPATG